MEIGAEGWNATIDLRHGGRIGSMTIEGTEVLVASDLHPMMWGCFLMAPFAGRIGHGRFRFPERDHPQDHLPELDGPCYWIDCNLAPHAIHGTGYNRQWSRESEHAITLELAAPWPFRGHLHQRFATGHRSLTCHVELRAIDTMPVTLGWHPWFPTPVELRFTPARMYELDHDQLPSGRLVAPSARPWDNCFIEPACDPVLTFASGLELTISSTCDHWVIYDAPPRALCVEPQSGPPDAVNLGRATIVSAGDTLHHSMTWSW